jgi:hypothetical protein
MREGGADFCPLLAGLPLFSYSSTVNTFEVGGCRRGFCGCRGSSCLCLIAIVHFHYS